MLFNAGTKMGISFGLVSGIITTLGLTIGLATSTASKLAVVAGILTIAFADAFSDALGMHISQEAANDKNTLEIWESTLATFLTKLVIALLFLLPILTLPLWLALLVVIGGGLLVIAILSWLIASQEKLPAYQVMGEHLAIAAVVVILTNLIGVAIKKYF